MVEKINYGLIKEDVQEDLRIQVYDQKHDNTQISRHCFLIDKDNLKLAQELVHELRFLVNSIEGNPDDISVFGRFYGEKQIIICWRERVTESMKIAISVSNRERAKLQKPIIPVID
ncbi:MAG TPA: hypothetical protein PK639_00860 [Candidatus Woesebacteria bacterium]|nr:hypothetical protein [Candidatus Woesebacteria bacterium]